MKLRPTIAASIIALAAAGVSFASTAAYADPDNIVQNTWYNFTFQDAGSALTTGGPVAVAQGTDGPLPGGGFQPVASLGPVATTWQITMTTAGYVVFTDVEASGDQFTISVNGGAATPTTNNLTPSGQAAVGDLTSNPTVGGTYDLSDIAVALGDADFSSGTFYLPVGVDTISGILGPGVIGFGDGDFLVSSAVPEPATWAMFLLGFGGIGFMLRNRRKGAAATA